MEQKIIKKIKNEENSKIFVGDILLFELNDPGDCGLNPADMAAFRSARHKNDMPSVFKFGEKTEAMKDCLSEIGESGESIKEKTGREHGKIISDSLTILGNNDNALFIAFMGRKKHLVRTEIEVDGQGNFISLKTFAEINRLLRPGEIFETEELFVYNSVNVIVDIKKFAKEKAKGIAVRKKKAPAVYCTWYYYGQTVTFEDCLTNLKKIKELSLPFTVFQIDDGWEINAGEWRPNNKFPADLSRLAETIKEYGLIPGIWTSPFIAHKSASVWKEHPDWLLKNTSGEPLIFSVNSTDYYIIDITVPDTREYFRKMYKSLRDDGFMYHKLDFTRAPLLAENPDFYDKYITPVEAYREACLAIRDGMGEEAFFLMCGGLYDPLIGIVDGERTGSDVLSMWSRKIGGGGKTLPHTMKQNLLRYYYNYWWYNDPDALMIRKNRFHKRAGSLSLGLFTDNEVKTCVMNQLLGGGIVSATEPLDRISKKRLEILRDALRIRDIETEIPGLMSIGRYPDRVRFFKNGQDTRYLTLFNFEKRKSGNIDLSVSDIAGENISRDANGTVSISDPKKLFKNVKNGDHVTIPGIPGHGTVTAAFCPEVTPEFCEKN